MFNAHRGKILLLDFFCFHMVRPVMSILPILWKTQLFRLSLRLMGMFSRKDNWWKGEASSELLISFSELQSFFSIPEILRQNWSLIWCEKTVMQNKVLSSVWKNILQVWANFGLFVNGLPVPNCATQSNVELINFQSCEFGEICLASFSW